MPDGGDRQEETRSWPLYLGLAVAAVLLVVLVVVKVAGPKVLERELSGERYDGDPPLSMRQAASGYRAPGSAPATWSAGQVVDAFIRAVQERRFSDAEQFIRSSAVNSNSVRVSVDTLVDPLPYNREGVTIFETKIGKPDLGDVRAYVPVTTHIKVDRSGVYYDVGTFDRGFSFTLDRTRGSWLLIDVIPAESTGGP